VSVERVLDKSLIGKPVIVGGTSPRGVVSSASYEARASGVHSAMPMTEAQKRCPRAIILPVRGKIYSRASAAVFKIINNYAPVVQAVSIDEAYLDLTGTERLLGPPETVARKMQQEIMEKLGLKTTTQFKSAYLNALMESGQVKKPVGGRGGRTASPVSREIEVNKRGSLIVPTKLTKQLGLEPGDKFTVRASKIGLSFKRVVSKKTA